MASASLDSSYSKLPLMELFRRLEENFRRVDSTLAHSEEGTRALSMDRLINCMVRASWGLSTCSPVSMSL